jgi:GNAT superfamily N-acetyltransferase
MFDVTDVKLRRATLSDAALIAGLQVRGSQWAYRGLMPDAFLDALSIAEREPKWRPQLDPEHARHTWIAEVDGEPLGFVTCGPTDDASLSAETGEVYAIYQEERTLSTGLGRALFSRAASELVARGFRVAVLWVLDGNARARRFYELSGWYADGATKQDARADHVRNEVRYRKALV